MLSKHHPLDDTLSLFLILPPAATQQTIELYSYSPYTMTTPGDRPVLASRASGSSVVTRSPLNTMAQAGEMTPFQAQGQGQGHTGDTSASGGMEGIVASGRRLSLAPGVGGGTLTRPPESQQAGKFGQQPTRLSTIPSGETTSSTSAIQTGPPAFGSAKPNANPRLSRRRPNTAAGPSLGGSSSARSSMALPRGMALDTGNGPGGLGSALGPIRGGSRHHRPGWEGDELVGVLRDSGLESEYPSTLKSHILSGLAFLPPHTLRRNLVRSRTPFEVSRRSS